MPFAHIASATTAYGESGGTSGLINSTGATLGVIVIGYYVGGTPSVSDSKGNTWTPRTAYSGTGEPAIRIYYSALTSVGASHTFTVSGSGIYAAICASVFSGGTVYGQESGSTANAATKQPGSITPAENNELLISGVISNDGTESQPTFGVDGGFAKTHNQLYFSSNCYAVAMGYLIQTTAAAANPTWSWGGGAHDVAANMATFKITAGADEQPAAKRTGGVPFAGQRRNSGPVQMWCDRAADWMRELRTGRRLHEQWARARV